MSKQKKQIVASVDDDFVGPDYDAIDKARKELDELARKGTVEAIEKIEDFVAKEQNWEIRGWAELALSEAKRCYYSPSNEREENDFLLAKMISERESRNLDILGRIDAAKLELRRLALKKSVCDRLKKKEKDSEYGFSEDYRITVRGRLSELENELSYGASWIAEAKKMIKNKKFKDMPPDVMESIHLGGEGNNFWVDEMFGPPSNCGCSEIEPIDIPF